MSGPLITQVQKLYEGCAGGSKLRDARGLAWGVYQLPGKLCATVYVWERRA